MTFVADCEYYFELESCATKRMNLGSEIETFIGLDWCIDTGIDSSTDRFGIVMHAAHSSLFCI